MESASASEESFLKKYLLFLIIIGLLTAALAVSVYTLVVGLKPPAFDDNDSTTESFMLKKFASEQEFKDYLVKTESASLGGFMTTLDLQAAPEMGAPSASAPVGADRVSSTNVQVRGIDEPDIVKVDKENIYYSAPAYTILPVMEGRSLSPLPDIWPPQTQGNTKIITAFPPDNLAQKGKIEKTGELLLKDKRLVIFSDRAIFGFDITEVNNPKQVWQMDLENSFVTSSRLFGDKVYIVLSNTVNQGHPCPIQPLSLSGSKMTIPCADIYYPTVYSPADTTYTVLRLDALSGNVEDRLTFTGSSSFSVVYISESAIYITYTQNKQYSEVQMQFYLKNGREFLPKETYEKIERLNNLDISSEAKATELNVIIQSYTSILSDDDRLKYEKDSQNRLNQFNQQYLREFESTAIVRVDLAGFKVASTGSIPGSLLNQFSLDEYQANLRVATTLGGGGLSAESANDLYVLDKDLKQTGSILNLGKGEKIYSVRFLADKGYMVTFKQTDPFFVMDLRDPKSPKVAGELKIPGFSSYLDPITSDRILGIGQEESQVKLSLFDVSSPANPGEVDKYLLGEYWTEVTNNHHAFLKDEKHKIFFIPASNKGFIFSYEGDKLTLKKAISGVQARRAIYINDYLYIVGDNKIVVLDERDFSEVGRLVY